MKNLWDDYWHKRKSLLSNRIIKSKHRAIDRLFMEVLSDLQRYDMLEIGSGEGDLAQILSKWNRSYKGIDNSSYAVKLCKQRKLNVIQKDMFEMKGKYDLIVSDGLIEHYIDFTKPIKKMCDLSREHILIIQPNHQSRILRLLLFLETFPKNKNVYEYNFRMRDFIDEFRKNSFKLSYEDDLFLGGWKIMLFKKMKKCY